MKTRLTLVLAAAMLASCFPYATSYIPLDAPGVTRIQAVCKDTGPPAFAAFERNGIRFELTLEPGWAARKQNGFLRVRVPSEAEVSLPDPKSSITTGRGEEMSFDLRHMVTTSTERQYWFPDALVIPDFGTLRLPALVVNGTRIEPPEFEFSRRPYAGIAPLNC